MSLVVLAQRVDLICVKSLGTGSLILVPESPMGQSQLHIRVPQDMIDDLNRLSLILTMVACGHLTAGVGVGGGGGV